MAFNPMMHCLAALLVLLLVSCFGSVCAVPTDAEVQATYDFLKNFAAGIPVLASEWTGDTYEGWGGVTVDSEGYVYLDLSNEDLSGTLVSDAATADGIAVVSIDLSGNPNLSGIFDETWAKLTLLQTLDLSNTGLYGYIPSAWNGMVSLTSVKISNVQACGGLPDWAIATLQTIDLSNAALRGALASSWSRMIALTSVNLGGNSFCACEPDSWKVIPVLHNAVSGMAVANSVTCGPTNLCSTSYICYAPSPTPTSSTSNAPTTTTSSKAPTTTSSVAPTTTTTSSVAPTTTTTSSVAPTSSTSNAPTTTTTSSIAPTSTPTTSTTRTPTTSTRVPRPNSAAFGSAALASCVTLAALAVAALAI